MTYAIVDDVDLNASPGYPTAHDSPYGEDGSRPTGRARGYGFTDIIAPCTSPTTT
ncbi:MAG TPA: hypothetical protein VMK12_28735 [Anaeromyxobacteraceae bacterium]|nr:hypothetical protein [Anaeromyxobacteraceae bacterium]